MSLISKGAARVITMTVASATLVDSSMASSTLTAMATFVAAQQWSSRNTH